MRYNAVIMPSRLMSSPTPESNARDIAALTSALDIVVSQFVRPSVQQANANRETLDRVIDLLERHAEGLLALEQRIEGLSDILSEIAQQQQANAKQIASNAEAISQYDSRLEETRQLVAKNASDIAQMGTRHEQMFERLDEQLAQITIKQDSNASQIEALAELSRTQLTGIISNGRRIERLEQQAS